MSALPQRAGWTNPFVTATDLKPGEYGQFSKLSVRRLTYVDWPLHTRIYAQLFLQAFGYDGEIGIIMAKSKFPKAPPTAAPVTPHALTTLLEKAGIEGYQIAGAEIDDDAKASIRIDRYQLRDGLQHLENKGLISRCQVHCPLTALLSCTFSEALEKRLITEFCHLSTKQRQGIQSSKIVIYLLARPRKPKAMQPYRDSVGTTPHCLGQDADSKHDKRGGVQLFLEFVGDRTLAEKLLKRPAVRNEIEAYDRKLAEVRGSAEKIRAEEQALIKRLKAFAEQAAQLNLFDDSTASLPSELLSSGSGDSIPASAGINATLSPDAKPEMVNGDGNSAPVPAGGPLEPEPPAILDWDVVGKAAAEYATINDTWVRQIVTRCQQQTPDVTPAELVQLIHQKGRNATHKQNAAGYLMTYVPQDCQGESFRRMRERLKEARDEEARRKRAASEPLPEYREPTTADLIEECDRRIAEARKELKAAKHTSDIVKIEDRVHFLESRKKQLSRQLTEVASWSPENFPSTRT